MTKVLFSLLLFSVPVFADYKYAPVPKGLTGTRQLACVAVNYSNDLNNYMNADRCLDVAKNVKKFYDFNSRGKLNLVPKGYLLKYDGPAWESWQKAELVAKQQFKADYYVIPNLFRKGGNHASNKIAHVIQLTGWVVNHEVGHLLGLGHTGDYYQGPNGQWHYNQYGDRDSVMGGGGTGSKYLAPAQYYYKGWLPKEEAAMYVAGTTYEMKKITDFDCKNALSVVVIPPENFMKGNPPVPVKPAKNARSAFVAWPKRCDGCAALYLAQPGGSSLIATFKDEYYDDNFTGAHIKIKQYDQKAKRVKLTVDFAPKPATFKSAPVELLKEDPSEFDEKFEAGDKDK